MNWSNTIDLFTFNNSYETYKKHFKNQYSPRLSFSQFYNYALAAKYKTYSIKEIINLNVINLNYDRLVEDLSEAYPDKPRGNDEDINSIVYNLINIISPVCIIKISSNYILLDGMHRIVASNLINSKVLVCMIEV
jgi:hypothetical protein